MDLSYGEINIAHEFHIIDSNLPIITDGILGRDFLMKYLTKVDYETFTLTMIINNEEITIPMKSRLKNNIQIPARTEITQAVTLNIKEDSVICSQELINGVFLANSIIPSKGIAHVKILNTLDHEVTINEFIPEVHPLKEYKIINNISKPSPSEDRLHKIMQQLKLPNLGDHTKQTIIDICKKYQDIFHLEGESLTKNNFYRQTISMVDQNPVYIKNYRLPHTQIEEINKQVDKLIKHDII